mmetsp:Transcript_5445/g.11169  ORF Transcript_5445/g.11169 Transcript_5445/m.11169 type:complete len:270 (+) Transcript_5445:518-1327(+)
MQRTPQSVRSPKISTGRQILKETLPHGHGPLVRLLRRPMPLRHIGIDIPRSQNRHDEIGMFLRQGHGITRQKRLGAGIRRKIIIHRLDHLNFLLDLLFGHGVHVPLLLFVGLQLGKEHGSRPGADVDDPPAIGVQEGQEGVRDAARSAGVGVEDFGGGRSVGEAGAGVVDYGVELLGGAQFLGEGLGGGCDGGWVADVNGKQLDALAGLPLHFVHGLLPALLATRAEVDVTSVILDELLGQGETDSRVGARDEDVFLEGHVECFGCDWD